MMTWWWHDWMVTWQWHDDDMTEWWHDNDMYVLLFQIGFVIPQEMVPGRMALLMIIFLNLLTIYMSMISKSPKSIGTTNIMNWMIVCIFFVFFALIEYGVILFCRFILEYKAFPKEYGKKQLMRLDLTCLLISVISFIVLTIIYFPL